MANRETRRLVVVVRPGRRTKTILAWLRQLLRTALLLVAPANVPAPISGEVVCIDADEVPSGPLSLAALVMERATGPGSGGG
jgi:hypothetical protein